MIVLIIEQTRKKVLESTKATCFNPHNYNTLDINASNSTKTIKRSVANDFRSPDTFL